MAEKKKPSTVFPIILSFLKTDICDPTTKYSRQLSKLIKLAKWYNKVGQKNAFTSFFPAQCTMHIAEKNGQTGLIKGIECKCVD